MCARVAQWWSIALPRRGSRVRIPSRALKEIEKRVIRWMALFSMFKPCRARMVRMSPLRCGRRRRTSPGRSATSRSLNKVSDGTKGIMFANRMTPDGWFVREDGSRDEKPYGHRDQDPIKTEQRQEKVGTGMCRPFFRRKSPENTCNPAIFCYTKLH